MSPPTSPSVRNAIASFEAHNDDIRKTASPPESPPSAHVISPLNSSSASAEYSPDRPRTSTTAAASQSRIHRLQRQALELNQLQQQQQQQQPSSRSSSINKKASALQARRLMGVSDNNNATGKMAVAKRASSSTNSSTRRQRQQQQRQLAAGQTQHGGGNNNLGSSLLSHRRGGGTGGGGGGGTAMNTNTGSSGASGMQSKAMEFQNRRHQQQQQMQRQQNSNIMLQQPKLEHTTTRREQPRQQTQQQLLQQSLLNSSTSTAVTSNLAPSVTATAMATATASQGNNNNNSAAASATRNSRMGKFQRIKKMRRHQDQSQQHHPPNMLSSSSNDDDVTLTNLHKIAREKQQQQNNNSNNEPQSPPSLRMKGGSASGSNRHWSMRGGGEEKSDKDYVHHTSLTQKSPRGIALAQSSSSEYDTDNGGDNHSREGGNSAGLLNPSMSASQLTPTPDLGAAFFEHRRRVAGRANDGDDDNINSSITPSSHMDSRYNSRSNNFNNSNINGLSSRREDDDTYDYSGRDDEDNINGMNKSRQPTFDSPSAFNDDDSQGSMSYTQKREREAKAKEELARKQAAQKAKAGMDNPFISAENMKYFENPATRTALGVAAAATVGLAVVGPVGLLLGAAAVGIGVGVMQIPEEQRSNMCDKATETLKHTQEAAMTASEAISSSCANTYRDSGIEEHVPEEMKTCCTALDEEVRNVNSSEHNANINSSNDINNGERGTVKGGTTAGGGGAGNGGVEGGATGNDNVPGAESLGNRDGGPYHPTSSPIRFGNKKNNVACLREGKIVPVSQIHALGPAAQPRAWLEVLASAETNDDEKMEAYEEILILAKDKQRARIFLEEGILDSIMWTLGRYFEKLDLQQQQKDNAIITANTSSNSNNGTATAATTTNNNNWANPEITAQEAAAARLAAICCLTLGKSHCAAIHTGGDLLLMSMYERGTVPEERQLAQMLHEVPFHTRTIKPNDDPTIVRDPSNENFVLKQMSLPQAEELAQRIKGLTVTPQ